LRRNQFHHGIATKGGAIYVSGGDLIIESAEFKRNVAKLGGGALYMSSF